MKENLSNPMVEIMPFQHKQKRTGRIEWIAGAARLASTKRSGGAGSIGLNSMQARETRRRPKIAAAFYEPNSPYCREKT